LLEINARYLPITPCAAFFEWSFEQAFSVAAAFHKILDADLRDPA
jgi:hypothetical protein